MAFLAIEFIIIIIIVVVDISDTVIYTYTHNSVRPLASTVTSMSSNQDVPGSIPRSAV